MVVEVLWTPNGGRLVVELPDYGVLIRCAIATDTFVEVIKRSSYLSDEDDEVYTGPIRTLDGLVSFSSVSIVDAGSGDGDACYNNL